MNEFLVQLIDIAMGKIIKADNGTESIWDSYTFRPVVRMENDAVKGTKDLSKSKWFKVTDENYLKLKSFLIDGNLFLIVLQKLRFYKKYK